MPVDSWANIMSDAVVKKLCELVEISLLMPICNLMLFLCQVCLCDWWRLVQEFCWRYVVHNTSSYWHSAGAAATRHFRNYLVLSVCLSLSVVLALRLKTWEQTGVEKKQNWCEVLFRAWLTNPCAVQFKRSKIKAMGHQKPEENEVLVCALI